MPAVNEYAVRQFLLGLHWKSLKKKGLPPAMVPDEFDLLGEGVADPLGLLETVQALERRFDVQLRFDGVAAEDATRIGVLCRLVAAAADVVD